MIERKFISQRLKELEVQRFVSLFLKRAGYSRIDIKRTPLGDKIIIYNVRPGLIVGKKGENIKALTSILKTKFNLDNPQIEMGDIENPMLDPNAVADKIVYSLEKFGSDKFKFLGYNTLKEIMNAGAIGAEIVIGGVGVPGARAKSWRFSAGHLKKSGDVSASYVLRSNTVANLKRGTIGIKISIIPPDVILPDNIKVKEKTEIQEKTAEKVHEKKKTENKRENKTASEEKKEGPEDGAEKKAERNKKEPKDGDNKKE
ncbi:30S ribosomal protein S3 [Candidatus Woesearchaeota archaeon]|nr:30S ribosomal protein S3 [Candidatus Woesearchaeota archaeon]